MDGHSTPHLDNVIGAGLVNGEELDEDTSSGGKNGFRDEQQKGLWDKEGVLAVSAMWLSPFWGTGKEEGGDNTSGFNLHLQGFLTWEEGTENGFWDRSESSMASAASAKELRRLRSVRKLVAILCLLALYTFQSSLHRGGWFRNTGFGTWGTRRTGNILSFFFYYLLFGYCISDQN